MKSHTLIRRYAQGFVQAVPDEAEFKDLIAELAGFAGLLAEGGKLHDALAKPFLPVKAKKEIVREVIASTSLRDKPARFIDLLLKHGRLGLLAEILKAMPELWNEKRGVTTFQVSSVIPLTEDQKKALSARLEKLERRPVHLEFTADPELIGGISLKIKHIVYDVSIRNHLLELRDKMIEG